MNTQQDNSLTPMQVIAKQEKRFQSLDKANGHILDFKQECLFAKQQILKNSYTAGIASSNLPSLQSAILNVAAIGISLNPALQHAYLVPRDKSICLDLSFRGLVKLATDSGAIKWAKAELVRENDTFTYNGPCAAPEHSADVFADRGEIKGVYCIAKLNDGDYLIETMSIEEINKIRNTSKAFKKGGGPWVDWYEEMVKKTIIKRAYKSWPQTPNRTRFDTAVEVLNQHSGMAYTIEQHTKYMELLRAGNALEFYLFNLSLSTEESTALFNSFDKGHKTKNKELVRELTSEGHDAFQELILNVIACIDSNDDVGVMEIFNSLPETGKNLVLKRLNNEHAHKTKEITSWQL